MAKNTNWYKIQTKADDVAEISIFGDIGASFWGDGVTPEAFKKDFDAIKDAKEIHLLINSPGGNVFDGIAIYNIIASARQKVQTEILGIAASAASIIALAGSRLTMHEGSFFMIHNAWGLAMGPADEMRKMADTLDKISGELINIYANHSDLDEKEIISYMNNETWFTAEEAYEAGFADEVDEQVPAAASISVDPKIYGYKHVPDEIKANAADSEKNPPDNIRDLEALLRDAGYSRKDAKRIAATGFEADQRDAEPEAPQRDVAEDVVETDRVVDPVATLRDMFANRDIDGLRDMLNNRGDDEHQGNSKQASGH
jgi:ATP-dependent Clp endopeptidase proteolytic subunit ClpP